MQPAWLVISVENPWLAASPDNRVLNPSVHPRAGLVEYKNPFTAQGHDTISGSHILPKHVPDYIPTKTATWLLLSGPVSTLLLHIRVVWLCCENDHIERIYRIVGESNEKLKEFYFNAVLPELACPRRAENHSPQFPMYCVYSPYIHSLSLPSVIC